MPEADQDDSQVFRIAQPGRINQLDRVSNARPFTHRKYARFAVTTPTLGRRAISCAISTVRCVRERHKYQGHTVQIDKRRAGFGTIHVIMRAQEKTC